jgi:hypothetical protein
MHQKLVEKIHKDQIGVFSQIEFLLFECQNQNEKIILHEKYLSKLVSWWYTGSVFDPIFDNQKILLKVTIF